MELFLLLGKDLNFQKLILGLVVALLGWKILVEDLGNLLSQINYY